MVLNVFAVVMGKTFSTMPIWNLSIRPAVQRVRKGKSITILYTPYLFCLYKILYHPF